MTAVLVIFFVGSDISEIKKVVRRNIERVLRTMIDKEGEKETLRWFEGVIEQGMEGLI